MIAGRMVFQMLCFTCQTTLSKVEHKEGKNIYCKDCSRCDLAVNKCTLCNAKTFGKRKSYPYSKG